MDDGVNLSATGAETTNSSRIVKLAHLYDNFVTEVLRRGTRLGPEQTGLIRLHDHKGRLLVVWYSARLGRRYHALIDGFWRDMDGEQTTHISAGTGRVIAGDPHYDWTAVLVGEDRELTVGPGDEITPEELEQMEVATNAIN